MIDTTTPTVRAISQLNYNGNIVPHTWYQHIVKKVKVRGKEEYIDKPYLEAIIILSDVIYWYRTKITKNEQTSRIISYERRFKADKLQRSYKQLAQMFGIGKDQARNAVKFLEKIGAITLEFRTININGLILSNVLFMEPVAETIARFNTPIAKLKDSTMANQSIPLSKPKETYTETLPETLPEKDTPNGVNFPGILEYGMIDEKDAQLECYCGEIIMIATLANANAECPKCFNPIRVRNWHRQVIKKPPQKARRQESSNSSPTDKFDQKPLQGFCALCGIPYPGMPVKKKKQWASILKGVADEHDANEEETYQAIKAIKDSEDSWRTFTTPYQNSFKDLLAKMLMRVKSGRSLESFTGQEQTPQPTTFNYDFAELRKQQAYLNK